MIITMGGESQLLQSAVVAVRSSLGGEFRYKLEGKVAAAMEFADPTGLPLPEEFFLPTLVDPRITAGPYWTCRAQIYASSDIWQRQLMARRDNELHRMRLDSLVDAALTVIEALEAERQSQLEQIWNLEKRNQCLTKAYADQEGAQLLLEESSRELSEKTREMGGSACPGGMLTFKNRRLPKPPPNPKKVCCNLRTLLSKRPGTEGSMHSFNDVEQLGSLWDNDTLPTNLASSSTQFSPVDTPTKPCSTAGTAINFPATTEISSSPPLMVSAIINRLSG